MARPVRCVETGEVFASYADAGRAHGVCGSWIRRAAVQKKKAGGFTWELAYAVDRQEVRGLWEYRSRAQPPVPVQCEDGRLFSSVVTAARSVGVSSHTLRQAMREGRACGGLHWRWVPASQFQASR